MEQEALPRPVEDEKKAHQLHVTETEVNITADHTTIDDLPEALPAEEVYTKEELKVLASPGKRVTFLPSSTDPIDYILVHALEEDSSCCGCCSAQKNPNAKSRMFEDDDEDRKAFEKNLLYKGLKLCKLKHEELKVVFTLVHTPRRVLEDRAERFMVRKALLDQSLVEDGVAHYAISHKVATSLPGWLAKLVVSKTKLKPLLTAPFMVKHGEQFQGYVKEDFFTSAERIKITQTILENTTFGSKEDGKVGIDKLVYDGVYVAAYPLHDSSLHTPEVVDQMLRAVAQDRAPTGMTTTISSSSSAGDDVTATPIATTDIDNPIPIGEALLATADANEQGTSPSLLYQQQEQQEQQQQHPLVQSKGQHQQPESVGKSESRSPIVHRRHTEDEVIGTTQAHGLMDVPDAATERRSFASHGKQDAADQQEESRPHSSAKFEPYASVSRSDQHPQEEAPMDDVPHLEPVHVTMTHVTNPLVTERLDQLNPHQLLSACATRLAMTHLQGAGNGRTDMSATGILADGPQQVCAELVVVESDLIVVPIFNPKVKPPKFDANSLGIPYVAKEDVCAMDDEKLAEFLASIMTALEIKPQSRQKSRASSRQRPHSGKADRSKIHLLSYVYNLVGDTDIANIFANSPVMPALCASFRTMPDFARERQAMVIGRILQTATMVFVEVDMGHILHLLSDALRDNFRTTKLKPLLASCLGEAMFYAATQHNAQEEQLPEHWTIPMIALKMIFKCLGRDEHSSVQLPAIRTIENLASTPGEHMQHLKRQDVMLTAWRVLFHSNNASIRRACASTLMHLSILDPGLCQGLIDNAGADHIVDVLADSNTRVQQATLTCCLSLFANPSAIPSRAVSALADSPQTYSNLLRCVKSKSLAVKAKAFLLLGLLLPREPSALCAALSTSAGLHSGLDQLMNEIKRINNDMIVDEDAEMLHYLQKCAMSFVHAVSVWAPTYVIELLEAFQGVEGRRNPTPLRSKRLFDLLEQLVLLDAVVQCDVFVALLAQHHIPDYLQMLFYVAEVSVADTMVPDASRDDIHKYISQIYTVVTRVIQFAPTELPLHLARLASIVVHFAESSRDALQMAVHTYAIASKLVHERNQWDRASATFLESEDLLAALPMLPSFILACQTSPAPVSSLVNHFLIDLWLAVQSGWQHNFMSSALVEQSLHQLQSMVDILSAAELESVQLPTYSTDRDSSLVVSNVLFIASAASPDSIFKWLIAHRIAVRVSLGFITELKALQSEYGEIESLESKLDCLDGITTFLLTILKLVNTKLGKSKFKSKQRAIEQHMAATLCLPEAIVQALSLIGDSKPELTQKLQLALVLICEGLGGSVPNLSPYRTFHTQVDTTLLDLLV
eukprot:m.183672 g.183672  ORF g.183672 m.183672 type:complete len:1355 (-) comp14696_c0_seq4:2421-6485(-)